MRHIQKFLSLIVLCALSTALLGCGGGGDNPGTCQGGPEVCKDSK